jgi:RNA polymerase sigma-70 factor (ECF subfamily)
MYALKEGVTFGVSYQKFRMKNDSETISLHNNISIEFEMAFKEHYKGLHSYANTIIKDTDMAEEMVQNVFYKLWKSKDMLQINQSVVSYLYRSVYNESLNYLKHLKVRSAYQTHAGKTMENVNNTADRLKLKELEQRLDAALKTLPEQCRTVFQMSRFEELKYLEIAGKLGVSVKTVENHMGKALRLLREQLRDFLPVLVMLLLNL